MKRGEKFEKEAFEFLKRTYNVQGGDFRHEGGMNSTKSDIAVVKDKQEVFFIEAKEPVAQAGQFVLFPNEEKRVFEFSDKNSDKMNEVTETIIDYMNQHFDYFKNPGTTGKKLNLDESLYAQWIVQHYKAKNAKYVISQKGNHFVIFPIEKIQTYCDIKAVYRLKRSGSTPMPVKDMSMVQTAIKQQYPEAAFQRKNEKLYVEIATMLKSERIQIGKSEYYFSEKSPNKYEVRKLSNTKNKNVIFSLTLKRDQDMADLLKFNTEL